MLTHAELLTRIEALLPTVVSPTFGDTATYMGRVNKVISQRVPFLTSETHPSDRWAPTRGVYTTDGTTREITLTDWDFLDLACEGFSQFDGIEYPVDQSPKQFRNYTLRNKVLELHLDAIPASGDSVYVYPQRLHILQAAIGTTDTAGAVSTASVVGDTSLIIKTLGTGTINKYTKITITTTPTDTTEYMVKANATIAANVATVLLSPAIVKVNSINDVVTLALADSTFPQILEEIFIEWTAGQLIQDYGVKMMQTIPKAGKFSNYFSMGQAMITNADLNLRRSGLEVGGRYALHSRS